MDESELFPNPEETNILNLIEAIIFAYPEPVTATLLQKFIPNGSKLEPLIAKLEKRYQGRGIELKSYNDAYSFATREDLGETLSKLIPIKVKLGRAALDALAIIAWHQPVTKPEIDRLRGVKDSSHAFEPLLKMGWIKPTGRRKVIGRPLEWATTKQFLHHFGLNNIEDLPASKEIKETGLDQILSASFKLDKDEEN